MNHDDRREEAKRLAGHVAIEAERERGGVRREHDGRIEQQHGREAEEVAQGWRDAAVHGVQDNGWGLAGWRRDAGSVTRETDRLARALAR